MNDNGDIIIYNMVKNNNKKINTYTCKYILYNSKDNNWTAILRFHVV